MIRRAADNRKALAAFLGAKAEIDAMLERLAALSADHFEAHTDEIHLGHVGPLNHYRDRLGLPRRSTASSGTRARIWASTAHQSRPLIAAPPRDGRMHARRPAGRGGRAQGAAVTGGHRRETDRGRLCLRFCRASDGPRDIETGPPGRTSSRRKGVNPSGTASYLRQITSEALPVR